MKDKKVLFFDIETVPMKDPEVYLEEPTAPSNYKDPEKIAEYINKRKAELVEKAALDCDLGEIYSIAYTSSTRAPIKLMTRERHTEKRLLQAFWNIYGSFAYTLGYNILAFDLPFLLHRSLALGVKIHFPVSLYKNQEDFKTFNLDLLNILYPFGTSPRSLKFVAKRYGLVDPLPELDGSQFLYMDDDLRREYAKNGVYLLQQLWARVQPVYKPHLADLNDGFGEEE